MRTRKAEVSLTYNGAAINSQMLAYRDTITYTDPASGEADTLDISINDYARQWLTAWLPIAGDTISAAIKVTDWDSEGDNRELDCGFFVLDDFTFAGWPVTGKISGVSVPIDGAFKETERSKTWKNVTVEEIGKEIAARAGVDFIWDVEGVQPTIKSIKQSTQSDCAFYTDLCNDYGFSMKVYAQKIIVFDREAYKAKETIGIIRETDITSWSWKSALTGTYTGGEYVYSNSKTGKDVTAKVGTGTRILKLSGKADSRADAERKIKVAVDNANHSATTLSFTMLGNAKWVASQCVTVTGIGKLSGKYYIDRITHGIGKGYNMSLDLSLIESMTDTVIKDAIERLVAVKLIDAPAYWESHYKDVNYLDGLLLNMATRIKINLGGTSIKDVPAALDVLTRAGVVNGPDYWLGKYTALTYLETLLIKAANALEG